MKGKGNSGDSSWFRYYQNPWWDLLFLISYLVRWQPISHFLRVRHTCIPCVTSVVTSYLTGLCVGNEPQCTPFSISDQSKQQPTIQFWGCTKWQEEEKTEDGPSRSQFIRVFSQCFIRATQYGWNRDFGWLLSTCQWTGLPSPLCWPWILHLWTQHLLTIYSLSLCNKSQNRSSQAFSSSPLCPRFFKLFLLVSISDCR